MAALPIDGRPGLIRCQLLDASAEIFRAAPEGGGERDPDHQEHPTRPATPTAACRRMLLATRHHYDIRIQASHDCDGADAGFSISRPDLLADRTRSVLDAGPRADGVGR